MPEDMSARAEPASLSERVERYRKEIESVVKMGVEHPRYELTRQASLAKTDPRARADFLKLVQGLANAQSQEDRFLVIGANQQTHAFIPVVNVAEFDPARVRAVLEKYLRPLPDLAAC